MSCRRSRRIHIYQQWNK